MGQEGNWLWQVGWGKIVLDGDDSMGQLDSTQTGVAKEEVA